MSRNIPFSITQLEYIVALHRLGHFAKAAEFCQVTQPTLSMQIQKLEEDLNVIIFDRSKKPILLTDQGKRILEQTLLVLNQCHNIVEISRAGESNEIQGHLQVGIIPTITPNLLPLLMKQMEVSYPHLTLTIKEMQTHLIIQALENDELDVGLLATPLHEKKLFEFPLYFEPFYVLCKKDHEWSLRNRLKYQDLHTHDIWLLEEGHCLRNQVLDICSHSKDKAKFRNFQFESGNLETLKNLVETYGGYTLIPALSINNIGPQSMVIPFERPIPAREVGLVYRREHYKSHYIEALGKIIIQSLPEQVRKIRQKDLDLIPIK